MTTASNRVLRGRMIVSIELNPFQGGAALDNETHHQPVITLDNGATLHFVATETASGGGEYGVTPTYRPPPEDAGVPMTTRDEVVQEALDRTWGHMRACMTGTS